MKNSEIKVTPSEIIEYLFCPRFIYFMNVLKIPQYEKRRYKVQKGLSVHEKRENENSNYLWKKIGATDRKSNVSLYSKKYNLSGLIDEIITLEDGTMSPIDYKFTEYKEKTYKTHRVQILCYCLLIEEMFGNPVKKGYIFYIRGGSKQIEINYNKRSKNQILKAINGILEIIGNEKIPPKTKYKNRCNDCTYKNICI